MTYEPMTILSNVSIRAGDRFWLPPAGSSAAPAVDRVFYLILAVCAVFFVLVVVTALAFVVVYRRRPGRSPGDAPSQNTLLEVTWTLIPTLVVLLVFYEGLQAYLELQRSPPRSYEIHVKSRRWSWLFVYPNGYTDSDLHVPAGRPVRLILSSEDVIHSLFIPEFRVKMDCVPGRYTYAWFQCDRPGVYELYCAEYCGDAHSAMVAKVIAHRADEFDEWLRDAANFLQELPPAKAGEYLVTRRCLQCHSIDGTAKTGPTFKGAFGSRHQLQDGSSVIVDENYIRESIMDPQAKIRKGYQPVMPTFKGILSDDEITYIIEYLKTLR